MLKLTDTQQALLALINQGVFSNRIALPDADWAAVEELANNQGVVSMLYAGAAKFKSMIPYEMISKWRSIMYSDHVRNERLNQLQKDVVSLFQECGIRVAVLKGTSIARYYKYPEIRCLGDIDLLVDNENIPNIGELLTVQGYKEAHIGHAFHKTYEKDGATVEVHYAVTELPDSEGGKRVAQIAKKFLDHIESVSMGDMEFPSLSETHQALMLLLHMERHMTEMNIGLRQICDWAAFISASSHEHWKRVTQEVIDYCGLLEFAKVVSKACVTYLGVKQEYCPWCMEVSTELVDAFMDDVLQGGNLGAANSKRIGSLFTDRSILGQSKQGVVKGIIAKIMNRAYALFPNAKKSKILLLICCIYVPAEFLFRSLIRMPDRRGIAEMVTVSKRRRQLIRHLHLYEVSDKKS